jgi:RNA polymerase sigma-70 factor (ECF subfamily)
VTLPLGADDDRALLDRLRHGDEAAYDAIFRAWYAPLVRRTTGMVRERAVAEELVQDVMLELWRRRETLDVNRSIAGYLFQAARNRALNHLRHLQVERRDLAQAAPEPSRDAPAPATLAAEELDAAIRRTMDELPPRCRQVFELSRVQGLRYAEIAESLGISVKAVEAQMSRALRTFRERLAEWLPPGDKL